MSTESEMADMVRRRLEMLEEESEELSKRTKTIDAELRPYTEAFQIAVDSGDVEHTKPVFQDLIACLKRSRLDEWKTDRKFKEADTERTNLKQQMEKMKRLQDQLESLCRELQRQNKTVMQDARKMREADTENQKKLQQTFQATLSDLESRFQKEIDSHSLVIDENDRLRKLLDDMKTQMSAHKKQTEDLIDRSLTELRSSDEERQKLRQVLSTTMEENIVLEKKLEIVTTSEATLRKEMTRYSENFSQFQDTLKKSSDMMNQMRREIDKHRKKAVALEREKDGVVIRAQRAELSVINMQQELEKSLKKSDRLEKLCSALQEERKRLRGDIETLKAGEAATHDDVEKEVETEEREEQENTQDPEAEEMETLDEAEHEKQESTPLQDPTKTEVPME